MASNPPMAYRGRPVLVPLDVSMTPSKAKRICDGGGDGSGMAAAAIKTQLRILAISIYNHVSLSRRYQSRRSIRGVRFFLCACHGQQSTDDTPLSLGRFNDKLALALCHWKGVYYCLLAEVKDLHKDIQDHFETDLHFGAHVLHDRGTDANEHDEPFTALQFMSLLEKGWTLMMDPRLLGPLETAVRRQRFAGDYGQAHGPPEYQLEFEEYWGILDKDEKIQALSDVEGLKDVAKLLGTQLQRLFWEECAPLIERVCLEEFNIHLQLPKFEQPGTNDEETFCFCQESCQCRIVCQFDISLCPCCQKRNGDEAGTVGASQDTVLGEENRTATKGYISIHSYPTPTEADDFVSTTMACTQMIPESERARPPLTISTKTAIGTPREMRQIKQSSDTEANLLAYVPAPLKTPTRNKKDNFPLGLYGNHSGGRYPKFPQPEETHSRPVYGKSCYSTDIPNRKPLPLERDFTESEMSPTFPQETLSARLHRKRSVAKLSSPTDSSPLGDLQRPPIPKSTSKVTLTQSFPVAKSENPRQMDNEFADWDTTHIDSPVIAPIPSNEFQQSQALNPGQLLRHWTLSPTPARQRQMTPRSSAERAADLGPLPDFIAPRPALKQRYVSAGGNVKLSDRPEIPGPALPRVRDVDMEQAMRELMKSTDTNERAMPRHDSIVTGNMTGHDQHATGGKRTSRPRISVDNQKDQRSRTGSFNRALKRVFSRHSSDSQHDG